LTNVDQYMALADFSDYQKAQQLSAEAYKDKEGFARMSLMNISGAGVFSADRSIMDYANTIWNTKPVTFESEKPKTAKKSAPMAPKAEKKTSVKKTASKKTAKKPAKK
ncbi:MAG: glycogen/starch/alpha-glucan phosphorylase, partial [Eubacterium sp.]